MERLDKFLIGYCMIVFSVWNGFFLSLDFDIKYTNLVNPMKINKFLISFIYFLTIQFQIY